MTTIHTSAPAKVILLGEHAAVYGNPVISAAIDMRAHVYITPNDNDNFSVTSSGIGVENFKFNFNDIKQPFSFLKRKKNAGDRESAKHFQELKSAEHFYVKERTRGLLRNPQYKKLWLIFDALEKLSCYMQQKMPSFDGMIPLDIRIESEIPVASGLGSSASIASALILGAAYANNFKLNLQEIANLAWDTEHIAHGTSSGVDPFTVTFGGVIEYTKGCAEKIPLKNYPPLTIGNTGIVSDTSDVVCDVMRLKENFPGIFDDYLEIMKEIIKQGKCALENNDLVRFGSIMNINHGLLCAIGVSCAELEQMVWAARCGKGVHGAKLCGAGRGGVMIALGDAMSEIKNAGYDAVRGLVSEDGVRIER